MPAANDITSLLLAHQDGDVSALEQVWPLLYDHLRAIAARQLRSGAPQTLNATALVHEAYLRLAVDPRLTWQNRVHFLAIAARCMRQIVVDSARAHRAVKRGGERTLEELNPDLIAVDTQAELILEIDTALELVTSFNQRLGRVAECRLFAGLSDGETAEALGMSLRTAQREWQRARAWLQQHLNGEA